MSRENLVVQWEVGRVVISAPDAWQSSIILRPEASPARLSKSRKKTSASFPSSASRAIGRTLQQWSRTDPFGEGLWVLKGFVQWLLCEVVPLYVAKPSRSLAQDIPIRDLEKIIEVHRKQYPWTWSGFAELRVVKTRRFKVVVQAWQAAIPGHDRSPRCVCVCVCVCVCLCVCVCVCVCMCVRDPE